MKLLKVIGAGHQNSKICDIYFKGNLNQVTTSKGSKETLHNRNVSFEDTLVKFFAVSSVFGVIPAKLCCSRVTCLSHRLESKRRGYYYFETSWPRKV